MTDLSIALYWHQHQPYYPDDVAGENPMPWVRLHGVKDYLGMAMHLLEFPEMRCTINLAPSLLAQIERYTDKGGSDRFLDLARIPADALAETDAVEMLDSFFMANPEYMIRPYDRYWELFQWRASARNTAREALRRFGPKDLRDLQVWFNLAWIHPLAFERDADLRLIRDKERHFSEADKEAVLAKQLVILKEIIPLHRKLAETGQVELTTTPCYHPILPLLLDKKLAREAMPEVALPRYSGGYPEDAEVHVARAIAKHAATFGAAPRGMWPAEGSVCQAMLPLLAKSGIRWFASDEEILAHSAEGVGARDDNGNIRNPASFYRPYRVKEGEAELGMVFRDHALSDLIGFHYQRNEGAKAAEDFLNHLGNIRKSVDARRECLVTVILDGENCWEHYQHGGVPFLRALYQKCTTTHGVKPVRIGDYLEKHPPSDTLPRLFAGSWIHHNFAIWVGHEEDNTAWDALHKAREHVRERAGHPHIPRESIGRAWEEIYIAEGSDWFWWYGPEHSSAQDALFDLLFRKHLQNVYLLLGDAPPPELARPIGRHGRRLLYTEPRRFLDVKIDGRESFFEWHGAGQFTCQSERSTMAQASRGPLRTVFFGFNLRDFVVRVDFEGPARTVLGLYDAIRIVFPGSPERELRIDNPGRAGQAWHVEPAASKTTGVRVGTDRIFEASIPFDLLGVSVGEPIEFFVELLQGGQSRDCAPHEGAIRLARPSADFERIMWDV